MATVMSTWRPTSARTSSGTMHTPCPAATRASRAWLSSRLPRTSGVTPAAASRASTDDEHCVPSPLSSHGEPSRSASRVLGGPIRRQHEPQPIAPDLAVGEPGVVDGRGVVVALHEGDVGQTQPQLAEGLVVLGAAHRDRAAGQGRQRRDDEGRDGRRERRDHDRGRRRRRRRQPSAALLQVEHRRRHRQQLVAGGARAQATADAVEHGDADVTLQLGDVLGHGRRRVAEVGGGGGDRPPLADVDERAQAHEVEHRKQTLRPTSAIRTGAFGAVAR